MKQIQLPPPKVIARIHTDFPTKFGIPRQSALAEALYSELVFEAEYRDENAIRGLEQFSHLWLIWLFSENLRSGFSPTVRPPKLGGNTRLGVFATRAPFRPNPYGLSCVRLEGIAHTAQGPVLKLRGADLMDGTPILDIKPYIPYTDCVVDAAPGYTAQTLEKVLELDFPSELLACVPEDKREALCACLRADPRPGYIEDPDRCYGFAFAGLEVRFRVRENVLQVTEVSALVH